MLLQTIPNMQKSKKKKTSTIIHELDIKVEC